jgi:ABC-type bacteriocin/lantibiotic exporter with double-glycine peptidase domain
MRGEFTLGMILSFQGFLSAFTAPAMTLISAGQTIQEMRTQMERVEDVMEYPEDEAVREHETEETELSKLKGNLELKNITFGYSRLEKPLIEDFSLTLKTGQRVALVGSSGSGKSTVSKLVSGLYSPGAGKSCLTASPGALIPGTWWLAPWRWWIRTSSCLKIPSPTTSKCGMIPFRILK